MKTLFLILMLALVGCTSCTASSPPACDRLCYQTVKMNIDADAGTFDAKPVMQCDPSCYAYSGPTRVECEMQCASSGYQILMYSAERGCICDSTTCVRPRRHGGCEKLPAPSP